MCAGCGLGKSRVAGVHAKRSVESLSSEKHISKMVFFLRLRFVRVLRCSLMSLSSLCGRLRVFSFFQPLIFGTFSSRFRSFGGSAPLVCAPAADFVAIDFVTLRHFAYFSEFRSIVPPLSGLVGPGPRSGMGGKSEFVIRDRTSLRLKFMDVMLFHFVYAA